MDADLEFCLGQFFDDQNKIIHCHLESIKGQEEREAQTIKDHQHVLLRQYQGLRDEGQKLMLKKEVDQYNVRLEEIKIDFNRKKIAIEAEKLPIRECDLKIKDTLMDPIWNKVNVWSKTDGQQEVYWSGSISRGNKPYYCPSGWKRYGIKVAKNAQEFDAKWGNWHVAYHGTADENASKILATGLKVSTHGCFFDKGVPRVYVSPSIEYCAHPRYARPWIKTKNNDKDRWYQLVFQCRVNPASVSRIGPETLIYDEYKKSVKVDPNFDNGELEWVILSKKDVEFIKDDIICYGLMMRISDVDPRHLKPSAWWKHSHHTSGY